jgi:hypothetical protein
VFQKGEVPRTAWGAPSLEGQWTEPYQIPLQRPAKFKDQTTFTAEQRVELDRIRAAMPGNETRSQRGTEVDVAGAYNAVYTSRRPTGERTSLITDPPDGRIPPVTAEVTKRRNDIRAWENALLENTDTCKNKWPGCETGKYTGVPSPRRFDPPQYLTSGGEGVNRADGPEDRGIGVRCMSGLMPDQGGNYRQIVQSPDYIGVTHDTGQGQGFHRVINISSAPHLPANVRTWWGDSRAKWEGDTLVVDITNFNGKFDFQGSTENLHIVERWTRTGPNSLEYIATFNDPTSWTKPWTIKRDFIKLADGQNHVWKEPRCHEGNFGMVSLLSGHRAQEKAFAEGRGPDPTTYNSGTPTGAANTLGRATGDEDADPLN